MSNTPQPTEAEDELRRKIRRMFTNRTHKLPAGSMQVHVEEGVAQYRTIIAPYEPTIEKIVQFIAAHNRHLVEQMEGLKASDAAKFYGAWNEAIDACIQLLTNSNKGEK